MKAYLLLVLLPLLIQQVGSRKAAAQETSPSPTALLHARTEFHFVANAPFELIR